MRAIDPRVVLAGEKPCGPSVTLHIGQTDFRTFRDADCGRRSTEPPEARDPVGGRARGAEGSECCLVTSAPGRRRTKAMPTSPVGGGLADDGDHGGSNSVPEPPLDATHAPELCGRWRDRAQHRNSFPEAGFIQKDGSLSRSLPRHDRP